MCTKWNREHQALWYIFKDIINAFKISGWLTLEESEEFISLMQKRIEEKDKKEREK